jgi:dTDP-4-dehydrorhamnose reductase
MTMRPALWGGVEATVNRVGDAFHDQCKQSGHRARACDDLELFANLGFEALRQPVLWETAAEGQRPGHYDLRFSDAPLARLRELGIRPIVGLVHHGSGPRGTDLLDPGFADGLAAYAEAVATRYPWVEDYTPVNEPLTTARFSCLYGHWYPHLRDEAAFLRALVHQCRATVLAMQAIRRVNPRARFVLTEDMGRTYARRRLRYQATFENHRRWLGVDLMLGRVDETHMFHRRLRARGIAAKELAFFRENPLVPDILGLNYYVTSDRMLDDRVDNYPESCRGGNGRDRYADTEAARTRRRGITGHLALLRAAWKRYRLPLAFTEVHLGCTREEQMRWLKEAWDACCEAQRQGIDARAITLWSLLGAYDWNSLVTRAAGHYEPGPFDLRAGTPRPTAVARMAAALAHEGTFSHPVLDQPGWWRRPIRFLPTKQRSQPAQRDACPIGGAPGPTRSRGSAARPLLILGAGGTLGRAFAYVCRERALPCLLPTRAELEITNRDLLARYLDEREPWAVVNAAGRGRVDEAEREPERCYQQSVVGPQALASLCATRALPLVTFSSDLVFDGGRREPYAESDVPRPLNTYGRCKREAEERVLDAYPGALVVRTSAFFGPWDVRNFLHQVLAALSSRQTFVALEDVTVSPTYLPDLVGASLDLLIDGESGLWHVTNAGSATWLEVARETAQRAGFDPATVRGQPLHQAGLAAPLPSFTALRSERGAILPTWAEALGRFLHERTVNPPRDQI